ncbi:hypothetical protein CR156_08710 [Stenotrophomonas lactitubi]|uniref:DUF3693 domain-containing protein n=1 Tax=Stenotrophomonas lactitubi TaxID=2045214 RepID=UPI000C27E9C2|nr:DUF3693 domain-containing protein [Stenotrophomonas lactitubi]PJO52259.1 hypothetical protein CR156_08710 [Stenotrophomonas lactitubi]
MSIVSTLIDKARQRAGIASDSALATQFGVHRQAVSKWRNGDAYPDEEHIAEMAIMAGDDPVQWLVAIKAVRADGKAGKAWAALAQRLAITAMALCLAVGFSLPHKAQAAMPAGFDVAPSIHYAQYCIGLLQPSSAPLGNGSGSGSALAFLLVPPTRTSSQHDHD